MCVHEHLYLKSNVVIVHASKERLKPLDVPFLCFLCNGLQNTIIAAKNIYSYAHHKVLLHVVTSNNNTYIQMTYKFGMMYENE